MKLIGVEDLPDSYKVYLSDNFRRELINLAVKKMGGLVKLSKTLGFDWSSLCKIRRGYRIIKGKKSIYFIKISFLKKLLRIVNLPMNEVESQIIGIAYNKVLVKTKLPIFVSSKLASLVGHCLGDGHVSRERLKYVNQRKELVEEVINQTRIIFGHSGRKFLYNGCYCVEFPGIVGRLLGFLGVPLGRKVSQEFEIPQWIQNGSKKIKSAFLRALFDDEGSVINNSKYRFLTISMYKQNNFIESHLKFLNQIRQMLIDLEIKPTKISFKKNWNDTKEYGFRIYSRKSLHNFAKNVGFTHIVKNQKLSMIN